MPAKVYHKDLYGKRQTKYDFLKNNTVGTVDWTELQPDEKYHFFVPKDFGLQEEYEKGIKISELFRVFNSGVETAKDSFVIKFEERDVRELKILLENEEVDTVAQKTGFYKPEKIEQCKKDLETNKVEIKPIQYRPFDTRYTLYSNLSQGVLWRPRHNVSKHFLQENLGLAICKRQTSSDFRHVLITNTISERCYVSLQTGELNYNFPLYLYTESEKSTPSLISDTPQGGNFKPNFNPDIIKQIEESLGMNLDWQASTNQSNLPPTQNSPLEGWQPQVDGVFPTSFTPTDLLDYIYAVLHSPSYRSKYKEFLKIDFPRVPFDTIRSGEPVSPLNTQKNFWRLVSLGQRLRKLHLLESTELSENLPIFDGQGDNTVTKPKFENNRVYINQSQYFEGVSETAWNFYIGGYQPAQKYLKDRKTRPLTFEEIVNYQKMIVALSKTDEIMKEL